jgi:flagellar hook assembly protein FlgD
MPEIGGPTNPTGFQMLDGPARRPDGQQPGAGGGAKTPDVKPGEPTFGDVWKNIQSKYGAKPEKQREIKKTLGKDDFLRIMVTQMKNQDPTSPFKAEQFAAEMAQFTGVEQLQNINQALGKMAGQNQPLERLAMTNMIGKTVTVDRARFPHTNNQRDMLSFNLPRDAKEVHVTVMSDVGEILMEKDLGQQKAGTVNFEWDGIKKNTLPAKDGNYLYKVEAKDERDVTVQVSTQGEARIVGVSFEMGEPVFLIGNPNRPERITMRNVIKIVGNDSSLIPGAQRLGEANPGAEGVAPVAPQSPNFISFQRGVGSGNLDPESLSPEASAALKRFQQQQFQGQPMQVAQAQAQEQAAAPSAPVQRAIAPGDPIGRRMAAATPQDQERGFPNGLSDPELNQNPVPSKGGEKK